MHRDQLPIAEPCPADWNAMTGDARKRFCDACALHVHDLSAMTEREARRVLGRSPDVCVRYACDDRGRVVHRRTSWTRAAAVAAALFSATPALASGVPAEAPARPTWVERIKEAVQEWLAGDAPVSSGPVEVVLGAPAFVPPAPPVTMGRVRAAPAPAADEGVIPEAR